MSVGADLADADRRQRARRVERRRGGYHGHDDNAALKWTGFGLLVGGASLIAVGAVTDDRLLRQRISATTAATTSARAPSSPAASWPASASACW